MKPATHQAIDGGNFQGTQGCLWARYRDKNAEAPIRRGFDKLKGEVVS